MLAFGIIAEVLASTLIKTFLGVHSVVFAIERAA